MIPSASLTAILKSVDSTLGAQTRELVVEDEDYEVERNFGFIVPGRMPSSPRIKRHRVQVRTEQWSKLVGVLFCMPASKPGKDEILPNLDYFHHRSALFVDFFCVGYRLKTNPEESVVTTVKGQPWVFISSDFNSCRAQLEAETKWRYSGETELLLTVARKAHDLPAELDLTAAIACNLEEMTKDGAFTSVRAFFEKVFQLGEHCKGDDPVQRLSDAFGVSGGGNLLLESVLSLLPESLKKQYKATRHYAVRSIARTEA
jgi:hypothetical protein